MNLMKVKQEVRDRQRRLSEAGESDNLYYCYRCYDCGKLLSKIDVLEAQSAMRANLCPCGCKMVKVTNPKWWEEILYPRMWRLIAAIKLNRIAYPPKPPSAQEESNAEQAARRIMRGEAEPNMVVK